MNKGILLKILLAISLLIICLVYALQQTAPISQITSTDAKRESASTLSEMQPASNLPAVEDLIGGLRQRLETQTPDDIDGWVLLAKSYHHLQRWDDAKMAFDRAKALGYTAAIEAINTPQPLGKPQTSLNRLLSKPTDKTYESINSVIASNNTPTSVSKKVVNLSAELTENIIGKVTPSQSVFIFARSSSGGPPLAAIKKQVKDFPLKITLDDQMAMMPGHTLSNSENIIIGIRISSTGGVDKSDNDIEVLSNEIVLDKPVDIHLVVQ